MRTESFAEILEEFLNDNSDLPQEPQACGRSNRFSDYATQFIPLTSHQLLAQLPKPRLSPIGKYTQSSLRKTSPVSQNQTLNHEKKPHSLTKEQRFSYEKLLLLTELSALDGHKTFPPWFNIQQLKVAYKIAARRNHPDTGGCHETFLEVKKHYEILNSFVKTITS